MKLLTYISSSAIKLKKKKSNAVGHTLLHFSGSSEVRKKGRMEVLADFGSSRDHGELACGHQSQLFCPFPIRNRQTAASEARIKLSGQLFTSIHSVEAQLTIMTGPFSALGRHRFSRKTLFLLACTAQVFALMRCQNEGVLSSCKSLGTGQEERIPRWHLSFPGITQLHSQEFSGNRVTIPQLHNGSRHLAKMKVFQTARFLILKLTVDYPPVFSNAYKLIQFSLYS